MRLLITGSAGYLGSEVVAQAVAAGHDVLAGWLHREPAQGTPLRVDLAAAGSVEVVLAATRPDVVVHTAYRQAEEHLERDVVAATRNLARAAAAMGARLVHLSTDLVFDGERRPPGRYDEDDEPTPVSAYGRAKLAAEQLVLAARANTLVVRTSLIYGKRGGPQELLARRGDVTFYTDEIRTPVHVADLAAALLELAGGEGRGILHVAGAEAVSRYELACVLEPERCHRSARIPAGVPRARNVALDSARARSRLQAPLPGIRQR